MEGVFVNQIAFYKSTNAKILPNIHCNLPICRQVSTRGTGTSNEYNELVITMVAAETETSAGVEKLVATTSRRQTGTHNNQLLAVMAMA